MNVLFILADLGGDFQKKSPFIYSQGESLKNLGIELDYFLLRGKSFLKYIQGISQLKKHLNKKKYDILHAHYSYTGWTVLQSKKKPVVVSLMGSDIYSEENYAKKIINKIILNNILKDSDIVVCKSERMLNMFPRTKDVFIIPNGVDFNKFFPMNKIEAKEKVGLDLEKKYLLFVGNIKRKEKNFKLAKQAVNLFKDPSIDLINVNGISQADLNYYYNASDILLFTSLYEGSPNVIKEALACNLPIISTDVGDVKERLKGVKYSYIVGHNIFEIKEMIELILKSNKRSNGRDKIKILEINKIARCLKNLYQEVNNL